MDDASELKKFFELAEKDDDFDNEYEIKLINAFNTTTIPVDDFLEFTLYDLEIEAGFLKPEKLRDVRYLRGWIGFRNFIIDRDNHRCQSCGSSDNLHVHHALPVGSYPEFIYDPDNCITLCKECHRRKHVFVRDVEEEVLNE